MNWISTCALLMLLQFPSAAAVLAPPQIKIKTVYDRPGYAPGDTAIVAAVISIPDQFHLYGNPMGPGIGMPLFADIENGKHIRLLDMRASATKKYTPAMGDWVWAYEKEAVLFFRVAIENGLVDNPTGTMVVSGLICHTSCIPVTVELPLVLPLGSSAAKSFTNNQELARIWSGAVAFQTDAEPIVDDAAPEQSIEWAYTSVEEQVGFNILLAIIFAFIAGVILNVMPCVLPVLGIKVLSLTQGHSSRRQALLHSVAFATGMVLIFLVLATFAAFAGLSWGQQFQNPVVLAGIICVMVVFSLGMFDLYMLFVPSKIGAMESGASKGLWGDFARGMFATILATPCSGPFLGATLAWTLTQKPLVIYTVFLSLGIGMAAPYVLLAMSRRLLALMPKPGKWMEDFKHFMGIALLGFALYLMTGLPQDMIIAVIGICLVLATAIGVYVRFAPFGSTAGTRVASGLVALVILASGSYGSYVLFYARSSNSAVAKAAASTVEWHSFSAEKLKNANNEGKPVIIDFTASWCMNCQYNKVAVLHSPEVNRLLEEGSVLALKADITVSNPEAESLLHHLGSRSVPFLAIFDGKQPDKPLIMRDVLSKKKVVKALEDISN